MSTTASSAFYSPVISSPAVYQAHGWLQQGQRADTSDDRLSCIYHIVGNLLSVCSSAGSPLSLQDRIEALHLVDETKNLYLTSATGLSAGPSSDGILFRIDQIRSLLGSVDPETKTTLGLCYLRGHRVAQDNAQAVSLLMDAAGAGNGEAHVWLGICYEQGRGVPLSMKKAAECYKEAALQGEALGQFKIGLCFECGVGVSRNARTAVQCYQRAAEQWLSFAFYRLGLCLEHGRGVERNPMYALILYRIIADPQFVPTLAIRGDLREEIDHWRRAAANICLKDRAFLGPFSIGGDVESFATERNAPYLYDLALRYHRGIGVERNEAEAISLFLRAFDQDPSLSASIFEDAAFLFSVALSVQIGAKFERDVEHAAILNSKAARLFSLSADKGYLQAVLQVALCALEGRGVPKNETEGVRLLAFVYDQDPPLAAPFLEDPSLQLRVGQYFQNIARTEFDMSRRAKFLTKAAILFMLALEKGHLPAVLEVALCYRSGLGVPYNEDKAMRLFAYAYDLNAPLTEPFLVDEAVQFQVAQCLLHEAETIQDVNRSAKLYREAAALYKMAAERGSVDGLLRLARCYQLGKGVEKNENTASKYYLEAYKKNPALANLFFDENWRKKDQVF